MTRSISPFLPTIAALALVLTLPANGLCQTDCDGYRYRYTGAFDSFNVDYDLPYGENINSMLFSEELVADVYTPSEQSDELRPLVLMAHGGFSWEAATMDSTWSRCAKTSRAWGM